MLRIARLCLATWLILTGTLASGGNPTPPGGSAPEASWAN
jgi:hypothetical protein